MYTISKLPSQSMIQAHIQCSPQKIPISISCRNARCDDYWTGRRVSRRERHHKFKKTAHLPICRQKAELSNILGHVVWCRPTFSRCPVPIASHPDNPHPHFLVSLSAKLGLNEIQKKRLTSSRTSAGCPVRLRCVCIGF